MVSKEQLPWCYSSGAIDRMIREGMLYAEVTIQCLACGAMGEYHNWVNGPRELDKLCPGCGLYKGVKI